MCLIILGGSCINCYTTPLVLFWILGTRREKVETIAPLRSIFKNPNFPQRPSGKNSIYSPEFLSSSRLDSALDAEQR